MSRFARWTPLIVSLSLWPSGFRAPKFGFAGCRMLGSFVRIRGKRSLTVFGCSFMSRLAQLDSQSCVQQEQFNVCCHRDPSRAAQFFGSSEYVAHFSGANYMSHRHTVGRVKAFELRPLPLVETCPKRFDRGVESGENSVQNICCYQSLWHSGASALSDHLPPGNSITSLNVSKVQTACKIHCF